MKYLGLLADYFGEFTEDVMKVENLLRSGDTELAYLLSQHIPNYEEKMLAVFKKYYPSFAGVADDFDLTLTEFFQYHFAKNINFLKEYSWWYRFKMYLNWNTDSVLQVPYYFVELETNWVCIKTPHIINIDDLPYLNTITVANNLCIDYWLPFFNPYITNLKIERRSSPPYSIFGDNRYYQTISKISIIEPPAFTVEYSDFLQNFDHISVLTLWCGGKLPFEFNIPSVDTLIINEGTIAGKFRANVFEKVSFLEVGMRHDIPLELSPIFNKILGMGFVYEPQKQNPAASNIFVTFKNKNI